MSTYSFNDVTATMSGPTGDADLGYGSGVAEEGISLEYAGAKNTMTIGADGEGMHSLHADKSGTVTVRLLKTSPKNAILQAMYDAQSLDATLWGKNTFVVRNTQSQDIGSARQCAFQKGAPLHYHKDGETVEWVFDAIKIDIVRGNY